MTDLITRLRADADVWDSQRISVSHYTASLEREAAAEIERLTRERGEWARKWHRIRGELAEIKWPGMKGVIRPKRAYYETHDPPHCPTCGCER